MSGEFDAFRLPVTTDGLPVRTLLADRLTCRYPDPTTALLEDNIRALERAGESLRGRPVAEIVDVIDAAAARFADPLDPLRERAQTLIPAATGYSDAMTRLVLDRMAADWRAEPLRRLLRAELGDPATLDRFAEVGPGRVARAYGPGLCFHVFAGNVPGVAVTSLVRSLLVKTPSLAKLAAGEPVLPVLFAEAVAAVDPAMGDALAVTYWPGGSIVAESIALAAADTVVVYGGAEAVRSVRERMHPDRRLVVHGPRFSVGLVAAATLDHDTPRVARDIAAAAATFDQQGCVSPHAIWFEDPGGGRADRFARQVSDAMADLEARLPRGRLSTAEASAIQQERGAAELRGHGGHGVRVFTGPGTSWTVVLDDDPAFRPSCLNRFLHLHPVESLEPAIHALEPHGAWLQSVGLAVPPAMLEQLAHRMAMVGATRVTTFPRLPWPRPESHHDGKGPLRELLRWVDIEV